MLTPVHSTPLLYRRLCDKNVYTGWCGVDIRYICKTLLCSRCTYQPENYVISTAVVVTWTVNHICRIYEKSHFKIQYLLIDSTMLFRQLIFRKLSPVSSCPVPKRWKKYSTYVIFVPESALRLCLSSSSVKQGMPSLQTLTAHPLFSQPLALGNGLQETRPHLKFPAPLKDELRKAVAVIEARLKQDQKLVSGGDSVERWRRMLQNIFTFNVCNEGN